MYEETESRLCEGTWLNSCIVGSNSYRVLKCLDNNTTRMLEEDVDEIFRTGSEQHFISVSGNNDVKELWLVLVKNKQPETLAGVIETLQAEFLGQNGFIMPMDMVWMPEFLADTTDESMIVGYIVYPYDRARYSPIRKSLMVSTAHRWRLAISLFERVKQLHEMGLTLNGFTREQIRSENATDSVVLCVNEYVSKIGTVETEARGYDFTLLPQKTEEYVIAKTGRRIDGRIRDVFSAATLSFYLIHYAHPFVGKAFASMLRSDRLLEYQRGPEYIFDPNGNNDPGNLQLGFEIKHQWQKTVESLKALFNGIFMAVSHPESISWSMDSNEWTCVDSWIKCLREDAEKNDNEGSVSKYQFEAERLHQV